MKKTILLCISMAIITGCAGKNSLNKKAAFALGLDHTKTNVTNVSTGVYETTFVLNHGKTKYNCSSVGGNVFSVGIPFTPNCIKVGRGSKATNMGCNQMMRAAGVCK